MDSRLVSMCSNAGLAPEAVAGTAPAYEGQTDPYEVAGPGAIAGCTVVRYGRFGNNVLQLAHAVQFARRHGLRWVRANGFGPLFRPGRHVLGDGLELHVDAAAPPPGASLRGRFFFWWGLGGGLRGMQGAPMARVVRNDLACVIEAVPQPVAGPAPQLHCHVRGGDVFGPQGQVNPGYVQPPLAYYTMAAEHWLGSHSEGRLVIVSEDRRNPCVDALAAWASDRGTPTTLASGTEAQDIGCLLAARWLVAGYGTFVPVIALLSAAAEQVTYFRDAQHEAALRSLGIQVSLVTDRAGDYIARGRWENSEAQREQMLGYAASGLQWWQAQATAAASPS